MRLLVLAPIGRALILISQALAAGVVLYLAGFAICLT